MMYPKLAIFTIILFSIGVTPIGQFSAVNVVDPNQGSAQLVIGTLFDSTVYTRFAEAFVGSSFAADVGITSVDDIQWFTPSTYDAYKRILTLEQISADIGWGGSPILFNRLALDGAIEVITNPTTLIAINESVPDQIAGTSMKQFDDADNLIWAASVISSFGFTVNLDTLAARGLEKPTTWEDLASPDFFTGISDFNVGLGNAPDSTSNTRIYQILIQKYGWDRAWEIMYQMAANGKIYGGSVETRSSVISGETAVALTIDYYGLIAMQENPRTELIIPVNASIVTGEPIAFANSPSNPEAANAFIQFVFSLEGQTLWLDDRINRIPIREDALNTPTGQNRPDIKELYDSTIANQGMIFDEDLSLSFEEPMRSHFESTISNVHDRLRTSWANMINSFDRSNETEAAEFERLRMILGVPAMAQAEAASMNDDFINNQILRQEKQDEWGIHANQKFDLIVDEIARKDTPPISSVTSSNPPSSTTSPIPPSSTTSPILPSNTTSTDPSSARVPTSATLQFSSIFLWFGLIIALVSKRYAKISIS